MVWHCSAKEPTRKFSLKVTGEGHFTGYAIEGFDIIEHIDQYGSVWYKLRGRFGRIVGYLKLHQLDKHLYTPEMVELKKGYNGRGLIQALYMFVLEVKGFTLQAGDTDNIQSIGGKKVWNDLARHAYIAMWAVLDNQIGFVHPTDENEVYCPDFEIYETDAILKMRLK